LHLDRSLHNFFRIKPKSSTCKIRTNFLEEASHEVLLIDSETRTPYPQHWEKMDYMMMMILYIFLPTRCGFLWTRNKTWAGMSPMLASLLHRRKFQNSCTTHDRKRILLQDPRENDDRETQFLQGPTQISRESPFYTCRSAVKKLGVKWASSDTNKTHGLLVSPVVSLSSKTK
jgi:hypothetical protein